MPYACKNRVFIFPNGIAIVRFTPIPDPVPHRRKGEGQFTTVKSPSPFLGGGI